MTSIDRPDVISHRFVASPAAVLELTESRLVWPLGGHPAALDAAAAAMLDCFEQPLSGAELAEDLIDALEMQSSEAERVVRDLVTTLLASGHLIPEGLRPMPTALMGYPPSASP